MSTIKTVPNQPQWRTKYQTAWFRGISFHVETDVRAGGRRVALHQYPKRNVPYAEDMGRTARTFQVQGYLIGSTYLASKNSLIDALEEDGPGSLRLPMPYEMSDVTVMVQSYSISETREKGGYCAIDMTFVEYGDPNYRSNVSTPAQIEQSAQKVEQNVMSDADQKTLDQVKPYSAVYKSADVPTYITKLPSISAVTPGGGVNSSLPGYMSVNQ
jgi:prophage DNA circulation protein